MSAELKKEMRGRMEQAVERLRRELVKIRTGRASLSVLDGIQVDYYNTPTPLKQVATLAIPEPRLITIQPWDPGLIPEIEKAVVASNLGLNPTNDGKLIRLAVPSLTEERRKEMVKLVKKLGEDSKIGVRNVRRDLNEEYKKLLKDSQISEDDQRKSQEEVQKATDGYISKIDEMIRKKEVEVMEV